MRCTVLHLMLLAFSLTNGLSQDTTGYFNYDESVGQYESTEPIHSLVVPEQLHNTVEYQSEKLVVKKFDKSKWRSIIGATDYNEKPVETPETRKASRPINSPMLRWVSYALIIGIVIAIVYYIVRNITLDQKITRIKISPVSAEIAIENIDLIDIPSLLEQAIKAENFRLAIRLYYLWLLQRLHALGIIQWKKEKTNRDYLTELFSQNYYFDEIKGLTSAYEQVWYGDRDISLALFQTLADKFESIQQKINTSTTP